MVLNVSNLLICRNCDNSSSNGEMVAPCPCEVPICSSEHCREVYHLCTTIFACQEPTNEIANFSLKNATSLSNLAIEEVNLDWYFFAFAMTLMTAGAVGNVLVWLAVCLDRALQNSTNHFLLSLAVADLIVSLCVMPLGAIPGFLGYWPLGVAWCSVYVTSDVLACTSSILHMCVISLGRYIGIRSPLRARHRTSKRHLAKKIACVWLLAAFISSSITVLGAYDPTNIMPSSAMCNINNRAFLLFGSVASFYAPMLLMVGSYALTLHLLRRKAQFGAKARAQRLLQQGRTAPSQQSQAPSTAASERQANGRMGRGASNGASGREPQRSLRLRAPSQLRLSEHKASTVLGLVFASFVLCWAPFFVLNVLTAVCPSCVAPAPGLVSVCLWLGYSSSTINPIIYTVFNRSFRAALFRLLRCRGAPPPMRFRSVTECRTITGNSLVTTSASSLRPPSNYPATFDILP